MDMTQTLSAQDVIAQLDLQAHPEGGWYRQTWAGPVKDGRPSGTCIYFLLATGERSHWHRVDAEEIWLFHAGDPLRLSIAPTEAGPATHHLLGADLTAGQAPQRRVPAHQWQSACPAAQDPARRGWTLVSCTVTPGFLFSGFELAPPDFDIT